MNYRTARKDFEELERIAELSDQVSLMSDLFTLMQNPTKKQAAFMYCSAIELWFREYGISAETKAIADRHNLS